MTDHFEDEPDFSVPIEPVKPGRGRPWMAAIALVLIVVVVITGLAGFGLPLIFHPSEVTVPFVSAAPTVATPTDNAAELAVIDGSGNLSTMDAAGGSVVRHELTDVQFTFPAWSPDGGRIAATGAGPGGSGVYVVQVTATPGSGAEAGSSSAPSAAAPDVTPRDPSQPTAVYLSQQRPAFYVYWTPNSRSIGFLSSDPAGSIQLRLSPADGSAQAGLVRQGSPMYWAWVDDATLFVHAGGGTTAFLGEVGPTGDPAGTSDRINGAGDFRAPAVSAGGDFRAYAGRGADHAPAIIVEPRVPNGSPHTEAKVLGPAAVVFDPAGDRLGFIARSNADAPQTDLPVGPLKVIDAHSSAVRTLLPGSVIGFFWSPDGRSIAALRVPSSGTPGTAEAAVFHGRAVGTPTTTDAATQLSPNVIPVATAGVDLELLFVDPAEGTIRSQRQIRLAEVFTNQVLPYFDQYALSHRVWSSDGRSIALPVVGTDGSSEIHVYSADGSTDSKVVSGVVAFWRP